MDFIYLSGAVRPELARQEDTGYMLTPLMGNRPMLFGTWWASDNGCFRQPGRFRLDAYFAWLAERAGYAGTCLFATAPDVVGDAKATWERSRLVLPVIRALGFNAALVAQDGIDGDRLDWDAFDALFVGGSTAFKLSERTYALVAEARRRKKWTHMGRVNSKRRVMAAAVKAGAA